MSDFLTEAILKPRTGMSEYLFLAFEHWHYMAVSFLVGISILLGLALTHWDDEVFKKTLNHHLDRIWR